MCITMTSTSNVPPKFYQVCRLCLTVVSDTSDLVKLAVFGRGDKCHQPQQPLIASVEAEEIVVPVTPSSVHHQHQHHASVIVKSNNGKLNRKNSNGSDDDTNNSGSSSRGSSSSTHDMNDEQHVAHLNKVHNNNNIDLDHHEHGKNINYFGNASSTNYGINDVADAHTDLLERIRTFLAVSVSRQFSLTFPITFSAFFFSFFFSIFREFSIFCGRAQFPLFQFRYAADTSIFFFDTFTRHEKRARPPSMGACARVTCLIRLLSRRWRLKWSVIVIRSPSSDAHIAALTCFRLKIIFLPRASIHTSKSYSLGIAAQRQRDSWLLCITKRVIGFHTNYALYATEKHGEREKLVQHHSNAFLTTTTVHMNAFTAAFGGIIQSETIHRTSFNLFYSFLLSFGFDSHAARTTLSLARCVRVCVASQSHSNIGQLIMIITSASTHHYAYHYHHY